MALLRLALNTEEFVNGRFYGLWACELPRERGSHGRADFERRASAPGSGCAGGGPWIRRLQRQIVWPHCQSWAL